MPPVLRLFHGGAGLPRGDRLAKNFLRIPESIRPIIRPQQNERLIGSLAEITDKDLIALLQAPSRNYEAALPLPVVGFYSFSGNNQVIASAVHKSNYTYHESISSRQFLNIQSRVFLRTRPQTIHYEELTKLGFTVSDRKLTLYNQASKPLLFPGKELRMSAAPPNPVIDTPSELTQKMEKMRELFSSRNQETLARFGIQPTNEIRSVEGFNQISEKILRDPLCVYLFPQELSNLQTNYSVAFPLAGDFAAYRSEFDLILSLLGICHQTALAIASDVRSSIDQELQVAQDGGRPGEYDRLKKRHRPEEQETYEVGYLSLEAPTLEVQTAAFLSYLAGADKIAF
jgi:hypothetical protein